MSRDEGIENARKCSAGVRKEVPGNGVVQNKKMQVLDIRSEIGKLSEVRSDMSSILEVVGVGSPGPGILSLLMSWSRPPALYP